MPRRLNPKAGGIETPPISAADIAREFLVEQTGGLVTKKSAPDADIAAKKDPTESEIKAYITGLETRRKNVSPYMRDEEAIGVAEREMAANNRKAAQSKEQPLIIKAEIGDLDEPEVDSSISPEAIERRQQVFDELKRQKDSWIAKIQAVVSKKEIDTLTSEAGANGKYRAGHAPCFVVDKPLRQLLKQHDVTDKAEIEAIKAEAFEIQEEIVVVYLEKRAEIYPAKVDDEKKKSIVVPTATIPIASAPAVPVPDAVPDPAVSVAVTGEPVLTVPSPDGVVFDVPAVGKDETVQYRAADGTVYMITRPNGKYRIQVEGEKKVVNIAKGALLERGQSEDWILVSADASVTPEPVPIETLSPEPLAADTLGRIEPTFVPPVIEDSAHVPISEPGLAVAAIEKPAAAAGLPKPEAVPDMVELDTRIIKLSEAVASERAAFIAKGQEQTGAWKKIGQMFRDLRGKSEDNSELLQYQAWYENKLVDLKNAKLERLQHLSLGKYELREEMTTVIRYFEFEEANRLYDERQRVRLEKANQPMLERMKALWGEAEKGINGPIAGGEVKAWIKLMAGTGALAGESAVQGVKKIGTTYNEFVKSKYGKLLVGASLAGGGAVALGFATGGMGTMAVGAIALKRLIAGAGVSVAAETAMDKYAGMRRENAGKTFHKQEKVQAVLDEVWRDTAAAEYIIGGDKQPNLKTLNTYLQKEGIEQVNKKSALRKLYTGSRKAAALLAGAVVGGLIPREWFDQVSFGRSAQAASATLISERPLRDVEGVLGSNGPGVEVGVPTGSGDTGIPTASVSGESLAAQTSTEMGTSSITHEVKIAPLSERAQVFLAEHTVKPGESIWKLAEKAVQDVPDMDGRSSGRFAKLIELRLQEKLGADSDLARAAGFTLGADGTFTPHHIEAGAKIELGKLFSAAEMTDLIEDAKSDTLIRSGVEALSQPDAQATVIGEVAPAAEPVVTPEAHDAALAEVQAQPVVSADTERFKIAGNELIDTAPTGPGPETAVDGVVELRPEAELLNPKGDTLKYVRELPLEDQEKVFRNFKRLSEVIFQTSDLSRGESYDPRYDTVVHPELLNARVAVVLADHQSLASLDKDALLGYDRVKNPLHYSQMKVVEKLNKAAVKTFGAAFGGEKDKTIEQYVLYLSALVSREGKKIPGFRMVN